MSQTSLKEVADMDYLKTMSSFVITDFTQLLLTNLAIFTNDTRKSLNILLQVPFTLLEQLTSQ